MGRYQQGSLRKRFGAWRLSYYITDATGKRKLKELRLCDDREKPSRAKQLRDEHMRESVNVGPDNSGPMKIAYFWDKVYLPFLENSSGLKPATIHGYKQVYRQHLTLHFATLALSDYKTHLMSRFLTDLAKTLRPRTLNNIKWIASAIFDHAVASGYAESNPIRDAKVLGKTLQNGETLVYTLEEAENIISALLESTAAQLAFALAFFAGMRKGEIQGLQWGDVDSNFIHVRRAFSRGVVGTPKSKRAIRAIPIIQPVGALLLLWKNKAPNGVPWVFSNSEGGALNMDFFVRETIKPVLREAGCEWKGFHAGRRGLGTELRKLTGNSNAGKDVLGHTTTQVTEGSYEGRMPEEALKGMKLLEAKVGSKAD